jgi:hypothetical protein
MKETKIDFSLSKENMNCFVSFFDMMKGCSFSFENFDISSLQVLSGYFEITYFQQFLSSKILVPKTLEESLQFISQSYSELFEKHFNQSLSKKK